MMWYDRAQELEAENGRLRSELAAEREKTTKLREALVKARDGLDNGGFISDRNRAAIDAVLEETKGDGDE